MGWTDICELIIYIIGLVYLFQVDKVKVKILHTINQGC